jgi:dsRNA-specific ribonuclease
MFTCTVELAGRIFTGNPGKTKKQAQKNAAMAAWSELKECKYFLSFWSYYMISSYLSV